MRVTWFHPDADALNASDLPELDDAGAFVRGEDAWVFQTWLRLLRAGRATELACAAPSDGLLVFHTKHRAEVRRLPGLRASAALLVAIRADGSASDFADFEILQNGRYADGVRRFAIPFWPQPGLRPRDPARGDAVRSVAFKGFHANLHPAFLAPRWEEELRRRGIEWQLDAPEFHRDRSRKLNVDWGDFRTVDVFLGVRPPGPRLHASKPASKLVNAWTAGTPALLGPEWAYRELRRDPTDYFEVDSPEAALRAIDRLRDEPGLYRACVERGFRRAPEFSADAVLRRWETLLFETIPARAAARRPAPAGGRRAPLWLRDAAGRTTRILRAQPRR